MADTTEDAREAHDARQALGAGPAHAAGPARDDEATPASASASASAQWLLAAAYGATFLVFGVVFGFQGHWLAAAIAAVCFASVFAVTLWARQRQTNSGRSFTRSELLGHAGMGLLTLATLTVTAISGDAFLLLLAAASLLTGIGFFVARIRRGEAITGRDLLESLL